LILVRCRSWASDNWVNGFTGSVTPTH